ncbi:MAG: hypothetical protein ACP5IZ_05090 [Thermoprotei archaeon]
MSTKLVRKLSPSKFVPEVEHETRIKHKGERTLEERRAIRTTPKSSRS